MIIRGEARISRSQPLATEVPDYARKYEAGGFYKRTGMSGAVFARRYSVPILVVPSSLRGH